MAEKRIIVDWDNTCRVHPEGPFVWNIINKLIIFKQNGYTLVLSTARGNKRTDGQLAKSMQEVMAELTCELAELNYYVGFELFDEIHLGKPYGFCYIDDKAIPAYLFDMLIGSFGQPNPGSTMGIEQLLDLLADERTAKFLCSLHEADNELIQAKQ